MGQKLGLEIVGDIDPSLLGHPLAQDGAKMAQDAQDAPKMAPRWPKIAPRWPKKPKMPQDGPKMAPRCPKMTPKWPQDGPKCLSHGSHGDLPPFLGPAECAERLNKPAHRS